MPVGMWKRLWLGVGTTAVAAVVVTGAFGVSGSDKITTIAGTGKLGYSGDGGRATSAQLANPQWLAVDAQGSVYIADWNNARVRKVSTGGTITTVAGVGRGSGLSGDGGPATSALIGLPTAVAVDGQGNIYITGGYESGNKRVRRVSPGGTITTFAGAATGVLGAVGDGGPATSARLVGPWGVAIDRQGNVYIADNGDARVRKVTPGGTITTFAGTGKGGGPLGDGGPATSARLTRPTGLAVDGSGNLYIAESGGNRVRKVTPGGRITTYAGTGLDGFSGDGGRATSARLGNPVGIAIDGQGAVYISTGSRVRKVSPGGTITTIAGTGVNGFSGDGGPAISAKVAAPRGLAVDKKGNLYIADIFNNRVRKVRPSKVAGYPSSPGTPAAAKLRTFIDRIDKVLVQSAAARRELAAALTSGFSCSISTRAAGQQINRVVGKRQSQLAQLRGLPGPSKQAAEALGLLRLGLQHSIEADIRYRDGFLGVGTSGCPLPPNSHFTLARQSDLRASAAKQRFVSAFNPLAKRVGRRTWSASEI